MKIKYMQIFIAFLISLSCGNDNTTDNMNSQHFRYYCHDGIAVESIESIKTALEENYDRIVNDLQPENLTEVTVRIWGNTENFENAMEADLGIRYSGATGYLYGKTEFRIMLLSSSPKIAVHEFAHVVSLHVNWTISNNPRWFWETVAVYESQDFVDPKQLTYMVSGDYPAISELNRDYNEGNQKIYSLGFVIGEFIIENWGKEGFRNLILTNADIQSVLGITVNEFERQLYVFIEDKYL